MIGNLTQAQLEVAHWLATQHEGGQLPETFTVRWEQSGPQKVAKIEGFRGPQIGLSHAVLQILENEELLYTVEKEIHEPLKLPDLSRSKKGGIRPYQFPVKKYEVRRTYILRNEIFRAKHLYEVRLLTRHAEAVLNFMITRPPGAQFATRPEITAGLGMSDNDYEHACQLLENYDLIRQRASVGMLWGDIQPTQRGRQVLMERSMENLLLPDSPVVNFTGGDQITVTNTGENAAIAAGRDSSVATGLSAQQVHDLFQGVFDRVEALEMTDGEHAEAVEAVELVEAEVNKGEAANEKALRSHLRNIGRMSPDILDVVLATLQSPVLGGITILRKVAAKAKAEAEARGHRLDQG